MGIASTVMAGPTNVMAMGHAFVSGAPLPYNSMPIWIDVRTGQPKIFDPWLLKDKGVLGSLYGILFGPKGYGKSASMKILAMRLIMLAAGMQMMRVSINDYKPEGGLSEYGRMGKICRSTVFNIATMRFNIFERRLFSDSSDNGVYELGIIRVAETLCEFVFGDKLIGANSDAMRVAMYRMLQLREELWSPHMLAKILRSLTDADVRSYYANLDQKLFDQHAKKLLLVKKGDSHDQIQAELREMTARKDNTDHAAIKAAGLFVASLLDSLLHGSMGAMFGTDHSLYDIYTQRAVVKDWRDVKPEPETLMRVIDSSIRASAIESGRIDLLPHIEIDDEKHRAMDNPVYARAHSYESEISRSTHMLSISASHRRSSLRKGKVGDELYNLGDRIMQNSGWRAYSRQDDLPEILSEIQSVEGLSRSDTRLLTTLPRYTFGICLGEGRPIEFGRVVATPMEIEDLLPTDSATERMLQRPDINDMDDLRRFAEVNGFGFLGDGANAA